MTSPYSRLRITRGLFNLGVGLGVLALAVQVESDIIIAQRHSGVWSPLNSRRLISRAFFEQELGPRVYLP